MGKNLLVLFTFLFSCFLFADDEIKGQIESLLREQPVQSNMKITASSQPQGLEKVESWKHQGYPVTAYVLQTTGDVTVTAFVCEAKNRYWYRLQGTILKVNLWYGYYQYGYGHYANNNAFFLEHFGRTHYNDIPSNTPKDLNLHVDYRTTDYGNIVTKYSHGIIYPGYTAFSYYCSRSKRYWVELVETRTNQSSWYGPYTYHEPQPITKLDVIIELDKSEYWINEAPHIKVWVQNNSPRKVRLNFSSGIRGDYLLDGQFQWSANRMSIQMLGQEWIPAYGKKLLLEQHHPLNQYPLGFGEHRIVGIVKTTSHGVLQSHEKVFSVKQSGGYEPPHLSVNQLLNLAVQFMKQGEYEKARAALLKVIERDPRNRIGHYNLACLESLTHNEDLALDYFEKSLEFGYRDFVHIRQDTDLNNIRHLKRFRKILRKYKQY